MFITRRGKRNNRTFCAKLYTFKSDQNKTKYYNSNIKNMKDNLKKKKKMDN